MTTRVYYWDSLKVLLMMAVIVTHSIIPYQFLQERWIGLFWILIMTFTMPLFMVISGYWYKPRSPRYALLRYLYPCILFSLINNKLGGVIPLYVEHHGTDMIKVGYTMWYIWALFIYALIVPLTMKWLGWKKLVAISLVVIALIDLYPLSNRIINSCRVVNFFPFYLFGIWLRRNQSLLEHCKDKYVKQAWLLFIGCLLFYVFAQWMRPGVVYETGLTYNPGLSLYHWVLRLGTYAVNLLMCICLIIIVPDKPLWFTKFGARTMNAYMLHILIVFPLSWLVLLPYMHEWWGYAAYVIGTPLVCCILFSKPIARIMNKVLLSKVVKSL